MWQQQGGHRLPIVMEPTEALQSTENALRLIIRSILGGKWKDAITADRVAYAQQRRDEEANRRDGVSTSQDLIQFTDLRT